MSRTIDVLPQGDALKLAELENTIRAAKPAFDALFGSPDLPLMVEAAQALREIRQRGWYKPLSWSGYLQDRFGWTRTSAMRFFDFLTVHQNVLPEGIEVGRQEARILSELEDAEDQRLVARLTREVTGEAVPSSASLRAVVQVLKDADLGMVTDPLTGDAVPLKSIPPESRAQVVKEAVQAHKNDLVQFQGTQGSDWHKWLNDALMGRPELQVSITGRFVGGRVQYELTLTDTGTGEFQSGSGQWIKNAVQQIRERNET